MFFSVNVFDMIRLYKQITPCVNQYCINDAEFLISVAHYSLSITDCVTTKPHLLINPYDKVMHIRVFMLSVNRFYVFQFGVLPAPVYNPHPGVLFAKSVHNPRVISR